MSKVLNILLSADQLEGTQATFSSWLVSLGDFVEEGQPIAELETDKVSIEICAEKAGTLLSLDVAAGDDIPVNTKIGSLEIGDQEEASSKVLDKSNSSYSNAPVASENLDDSKKIQTEKAEDIAPAKALLSPAVRRLIKENDIDISHIHGSGKRGRVTRNDIQNYLNEVETHQLPSVSSRADLSSSPLDESLPRARDLKGEMLPHTNMRKSIASHMVSSLLETSPHVTSVFEMDMSNIIEHRKWHKKEFEDYGVKLTFTAYFLSAMAKAAALVPQVNARFHKDALEIFSDINIGVGTALGGTGTKDSGLVVPVVQQVQNMNLFQIAKSLSQQTEKARENKLQPSDMKNGTITISNHGVSGSLFATPIIINQPQVAILGVGKLEKRVAVEEIDGKDEMVIRPKCYVSLSIDHRALDAHQTNLFLSEFVAIIESWGE